MNHEIMQLLEIVTAKTEFTNYKSIQQAQQKKLEERITALEKRINDRSQKQQKER